MASPTTTGQAAFAAMLPSYWDRLLGDNLNPNLYFYDLGEKRRLPANFGISIRIPRIQKSTITWAEPTEGLATATCPLSTQFVSGTLKKFKGAVKHSDLVIMTGLSDIIQLSLERISYDMAKTMDSHTRNQVSSTGLSFAAGASTPLSAIAHANIRNAQSIRPKDLIGVEIKLESQDVPRFPGTNKYAAVIHPRSKYDIMTNTSTTFAGWIDVNKYNNAEKIFNGEIGSLFGFKFLTTTNQKIGKGISLAGSGAQSYFIGPRAYYVIELNEMAARTYVHGLGSAGAADATNDFATVGAKVFFTAIPATFAESGGAVATDARMVRLYSGLAV